MKPAEPGIQNIGPCILGRESRETSASSEIAATVTELFDQHRTGLLRYLSSCGLCLSDAEEVVQETFLALFDHLDRGRPRRNLTGWLFRVAHNLGLKRRERNGRTFPAEHVGRIAPATPEEEVRAKQDREILFAAVERLSERDRQCLFLRAEGLRYREIAEITGLSLGGVALALGRALGAVAPKSGGTG